MGEFIPATSATFSLLRRFSRTFYRACSYP
jgi:hypothetical protein